METIDYLGDNLLQENTTTVWDLPGYNAYTGLFTFWHSRTVAQTTVALRHWALGPRRGDQTVHGDQTSRYLGQGEKWSH